MAKCHRVWISLLFCYWMSLQRLTVNGQAGSLGFYLNGAAYQNGSTVLRTDIGEDEAALQCTTDSSTCCSNVFPETRAGEFVFPDGRGQVPIRVSAGLFGYYRDRGSQHIRLNRLSNATLTGQFGCLIPDASGTTATLLINIVDINVSITALGANSVGDRYSLECSAVVNGSSDSVNFTWLNQANVEVPLEMINTTASTSTLIFDPLSVPHAGTYTCQVTLGGAEQRASFTVEVQGVFLSFMGTPVPNNSYVDVNQIGEGGAGGSSDAEGVLCLTNKVDCCGSSQVPGGGVLGDWFFPNGTLVGSKSPNAGAGRTDFFFRNRFQSVIRLLRVGNPPETGLFRCVIPDANNVNQSLYVNVVNITPTPTTSTISTPTTSIGSTLSPRTSLLTITTLGNNTAGEAYSLRCSAMIIGSTNQPIPTITWLDNSNSQVISGTRRTTSAAMMDSIGAYYSLLSFIPLLESDAGLYTCRVVVGNMTEVKTQNITVNDAVIEISDGGSIPMAGQNYTLTCNIVGNFNLSYTYQWRRNGAPLQTGPVLSFSPLQLSHAGQYVCETIGDSSSVSDVFNITLQVPTPIVSVAGSNLSAPFNGTVYNLTGAIQLDMNIVDTVIIATWEWSRGGQTLRILETVSPYYQSVLTFHPLATNSSGEYRLSVTLRSQNNTAYVIQSRASIAYSMLVLPLPDSPPTISITSRHPIPDEICGEVMSLSCTANPVEGLFAPPSITWIDPSGDQVPVGGNNNPTVEAETGNLVFSDVMLSNRGTYTCCAVINISEAFIYNHFDQMTTLVNTIFPGTVENLRCTSSSYYLILSWELPRLLGNEVIDYVVELKKLQSREGTRNLVETSIANFVTNDMMTANVSHNLGLVPEVPYNITVKALNSAGCGDEKQIYCFTQEGVPPAPINVTVVRFNSTTVGISWVKYTLVELKGLASYVITYSIVISTRKRQFGGTITVPWTDSTAVITNLQPGAQYDIDVQTSTSVGMSVPVRVRTANEPESTRDDSLTVIAIVCGVVAVVVVISLAAIVIAALRYVMKVHHRRSFHLARRSFDSPFMMSNEFYESSTNGDHLIRIDSIDHTQNGYESLEKFGESYANPQAPQPYLEIKILTEKPPSQQPQLSSRIGVAQCPLYASVTGDDSVDRERQSETSFSQPAASANSEWDESQEERYVVHESHVEAAYATIR